MSRRRNKQESSEEFPDSSSSVSYDSVSSSSDGQNYEPNKSDSEESESSSEASSDEIITNRTPRKGRNEKPDKNDEEIKVPYSPEVEGKEFGDDEDHNDAQNDPPHFNIIICHSRLEVIEARISDDKIQNLIHPAQTLSYDRTHQEPLKLSKKEAEKKNHYKIIQTPKRIPLFWTRRQWDKPETIMTKNESEELEQAIMALEPINSDGQLRKWYSSGRKRDASRLRKKRQSFTFVASLLDYNTDTFEDQTDFDFYD